MPPTASLLVRLLPLLLVLSCREDTEVEWSDSCSVSCPEAYAKRVSICQGLNPNSGKALEELRLCVADRCGDDCDPSKSTAFRCSGCKDSACPEARAFCDQN